MKGKGKQPHREIPVMQCTRTLASFSFLTLSAAAHCARQSPSISLCLGTSAGHLGVCKKTRGVGGVVVATQELKALLILWRRCADGVVDEGVPVQRLAGGHSLDRPASHLPSMEW